MIKLPRSLSFQLTFWYSSAFVMFQITAFCAAYWLINAVLYHDVDEDLREDIREFKMLYNAGAIHRVQHEIQREMMTDDQSKVFFRLLDSHGNILFNSDLSHWPGLVTDSKVIQQLISVADSVTQSIEISGHEYATRVIYGVIAPGTILHIGESLEEQVEVMEVLLVVFSVMFVLVVPLASFVGWLMARQAVQGIEEVSQTAANIESGQLDQRVSVKARGEEVQKLANTFNAMLDRIRDLMLEMREMTDNIAHDLRSPLARIRAISEGALSSHMSITEHQVAASDTIEECDRLLQMINATLDVAEAEAGTASTQNEAINLSKLVNDACELFEPVAEQKEITLLCRVTADCRIDGNIQYLQRMLANLLDNALKYNASGGQVRVELVCTEKNITMTVSDTGIGIPQSDQIRIFERFFRCDQSRSQHGCGMGLSFARAVARSHGGEISVTSQPGVGSTFTVMLPFVK